MSLSQDPAFSTLKNSFVCGYTDITNQTYSGVSGRHERQGNAVHTTNGAGPHNLQLFMLASDGTVLHCLPGFWDARDLSREMTFAYQLNKVWSDRTMSKSDKDRLFKQMQLAHIDTHPQQMVRRSHMQGFDQLYEAQHKLRTSDTILDQRMVKEGLEQTGHAPWQAFKTTDVLLHERMASRPFMPFHRFDVAAFSDYGKPRYDKDEDQFDARSGRKMAEMDHKEMQSIGNADHYKHPPNTAEETTSNLWGAK